MSKPGVGYIYNSNQINVNLKVMEKTITELENMYLEVKTTSDIDNVCQNISEEKCNHKVHCMMKDGWTRRYCGPVDSKKLSNKLTRERDRIIQNVSKRSPETSLHMINRLFLTSGYRDKTRLNIILSKMQSQRDHRLCLLYWLLYDITWSYLPESIKIGQLTKGIEFIFSLEHIKPRDIGKLSFIILSLASEVNTK